MFSQDAKKAPKKRRLPHRVLTAGLILGLLIFLGLEMGGIVYYLVSHDLPDIRTIEDFKPPLVTEVYDRNGRLIGTHWTERRRMVRLDQLPRHVVFAFLAAEDADFYTHHGLDFQGIVRAAYSNFVSGRVRQGASTITQQVVRNLLLSQERTLDRKLREAILAWRLEERMKKDDILFIYVNLVFFGSRAYGVEEAAHTYFGVNARQLTLAEAAMLAGLVQAPGRLSPNLNAGAAKKRQEWVLDQMVSHGFIGAAQAAAAKAEPIELHEEEPYQDPEAPYFQEAVNRELVRILGPEAVARGGYQVYTTLDPVLQAEAENSVRRGVESLDARYRRGGYTFPVLSAAEQEQFLAKAEREFAARPLMVGEVVGALVTGAKRGQLELMVGRTPAQLSLSSIPGRWRRELNRLAPAGQSAPVGAVIRSKVVEISETGEALVLAFAPAPEAKGMQAALVSLDPVTREVKALVGGYDYNISNFDRATQSRRPPGSAMKPIVYSAAFSTGEWTPASALCDCPQTFRDADDHLWSPHNYSGNYYYSSISLHQALVHSMNVVTATLASRIGLQKVIDRAHEMGLSENFPFALSISLGSYGVSLLEMANAYAVFADDGLFRPPVFIARIIDRDGRVIYSANQQPLRILSPEQAYLMVHLLNHVVNDGTARRALGLGRPSAGKTGTTSDFRDAWYIGFTPELVTGVWIGRDDFQSIGYGVTGGHNALPIWLSYMRQALRDAPARWFTPPEGLDIARMDPVGSGLPKREEDEEMPSEEIFTKTEITAKDLMLQPGQSAPGGNVRPAAAPEFTSADYVRVFVKPPDPKEKKANSKHIPTNESGAPPAPPPEFPETTPTP